MTPPPESPPAVVDFDAAMYMDIVREDPPLKRYVSRGDTRDSIDIPGPHEEADRAIFRAVRFTMQDGMPRFQPVLGSAGMGKTHLFWVLKDREDYFKKGRFIAVYVPSPPAPVRIPLHFHACIVDEAGEKIFDEAVDMLMKKFGGLGGVTHELYDYSYALERLLVEYPGISSDVVKVLLRYRLDPANTDLARRWLLGEALSDHEIERLGVRTIFEDDDVTMATLKLLAEGSTSPILLFLDEMEGPYNAHGEEGERQFFEVLKRLYNECKNVVLIASSLTEIWDRIYDLADGPTKSRMERPVHLKLFTREDVQEFIQETMKEFWNSQNIEAPPDLAFPFSQQDIDEVFETSEGNPREAIRHAISRLDAMLFEKVEEPVEEQPDYVVKLTPTVLIGTLIGALQISAKACDAEVKLDIKATERTKESTAIVVLRKGKKKKKIALDVPNVKDWDRSGGIAAFYSAKRLKQILDEEEADIAMTAIPEGTAGAKFKAIDMALGPKLVDVELNVETGAALVENTLKGSLTKAQSKVFDDLIDWLCG
jgi:hypothetical protein